MHCLTRRAKASSAITFANANNEDLDALYADLPHKVDDLELDNPQTQTAGVGTANDDDGGMTATRMPTATMSPPTTRSTETTTMTRMMIAPKTMKPQEWTTTAKPQEWGMHQVRIFV